MTVFSLAHGLVEHVAANGEAQQWRISGRICELDDTGRCDPLEELETPHQHLHHCVLALVLVRLCRTQFSSRSLSAPSSSYSWEVLF